MSSEISALPVAAPHAALPESPRAEPPRPLIVGSFLRLEFEIKEVVLRGMVNLYRAEDELGDAVFIAERTAENCEDWKEASAPPLEENPAGLTPPSNHISEGAASLFTGEHFSQEGRDYIVWPGDGGTPLTDWRAPANDETYLALMQTLADGLAALEEKQLHAELSRELLRIGEDGALTFCGFTEAIPNPRRAPLEQLRELSSYLLKRALAPAITMRLDDQFGALAMSDEVKNFARALEDGSLESVEQAVAALAMIRPPGEVKIDVALLTDVGQQRALNEDAGAIFRVQRAAHLGSCDFDCYVVSDGMGGHEGGEVASDLTLTTLHSALMNRAATVNWHDNVAVRAALLEVIDEVNAAVVELTETPPYRGKKLLPGATLVFALRLGRRVFIGNVGDSRAYLWNAASGPRRASKDHSYVQMLLDRGEITEEQAWDHPEGSTITANIGDPKLKHRDVFLRLCKPGDKILLVSDGVVDMLRDAEIAALMNEADPRAVVRDLVDASNLAGGGDNITALCVNFL